MAARPPKIYTFAHVGRAVSSMGRVAIVAVLTLLAVAGPATVAGGDAGGSTLPAAGTGLDADEVVVGIDVQPDGSAVWEVEYRTRLDDEAASAGFEDVRADVESDPLNYTGPFAESMTALADRAADRTGREMEIRNVTVHAERRNLPEEYGILTYRFRWTGFAAVDGDRLRVEETLSDFFLTEEMTLLISWPEGFELDAAEPAPDEQRARTLVWNGDREFGPSEPRIVLTGETETEGLFGVPVAVLAGGGLLGGLVVASVSLLWRRRSGGSPEESEPEPELLSDEERVLRLLDERGGRVKQQELVSELGWSESKTSDVVSELQETETIEVVRIGRENVVALPGEIEI